MQNWPGWRHTVLVVLDLEASPDAVGELGLELSPDAVGELGLESSPDAVGDRTVCGSQSVHSSSSRSVRAKNSAKMIEMYPWCLFLPY